ncbi:hypothetical protein EA137_20045 [Proteus mirabilis]|nr:hypothetical protein EA137_20045 [Proteus mirabilis]TRY03273.1 hypothetical protein FNU71_10645 [Proteus mirabilis]
MLFLFCLLFTNIIITIEIKQTSNIKHQTSNIKHQTSNIKHQTSNIKQLNIINDTLILNKPIN